jgi:hypothetical protein
METMEGRPWRRSPTKYPNLKVPLLAILRMRFINRCSDRGVGLDLGYRRRGMDLIGAFVGPPRNEVQQQVQR